KQDIKEVIKPSDVLIVLEGIARELSLQINTVFSKNEGPMGASKEKWSLTKEYVTAVERLNEYLKIAAQMTNTEVKKAGIFSEQINEAKEISAGHLLTHSAPSERMYQILKSGNLSSVLEKRRRGED